MFNLSSIRYELPLLQRPPRQLCCDATHLIFHCRRNRIFPPYRALRLPKTTLCRHGVPREKKGEKGEWTQCI